MIFYTDTQSIHGSYKRVYSQYNYFHACLIHRTITDKSISTKQYPKHYIFVSAENTKQPSNNKGQKILISENLLLLYYDRFQVNYTTQLMYPGSASMLTRPECGVIGTSIVDLTSKSALLLFSLIRPH